MRRLTSHHQRRVQHLRVSGPRVRASRHHSAWRPSRLSSSSSFKRGCEVQNVSYTAPQGAVLFDVRGPARGGASLTLLLGCRGWSRCCRSRRRNRRYFRSRRVVARSVRTVRVAAVEQEAADNEEGDHGERSPRHSAAPLVFEWARSAQWTVRTQRTVRVIRKGHGISPCRLRGNLTPQGLTMFREGNFRPPPLCQP